jgi:hypothetical protein
VEEAKRLNANTIDTAHILLALLKEDLAQRGTIGAVSKVVDRGCSMLQHVAPQDNGNAVKILEKLGVDPSKMPDEIIKDSVEFSRGSSKSKAVCSLLVVGRFSETSCQDMSSMCSQTVLGDCEPEL